MVARVIKKRLFTQNEKRVLYSKSAEISSLMQFITVVALWVWVFSLR
jgi:hypothetical protein